jgi:hypothetical protein
LAGETEVLGENHILKRIQLNNALNGVYTELLHDLTAVLKGSAAKGERAKATITTFLSMEEL